MLQARKLLMIAREDLDMGVSGIPARSLTIGLKSRVNSGDLRALEADISHQSLLTEVEGISVVLERR